MKDINLIELEKKPTKLFNSVNGLATKLAVILIIIAGSGAALFFILISLIEIRLNSAQTRNNSLKADVAKLEKVEQRLFLVKDRLDKIGKIQTANSIKDEIQLIEEIKSKVEGSPTEINSITLLSNKVTLSFITNSSAEIAKLITYFPSDKIKSLKMDNFDYTPTRGYNIVFDFSLI